MSFSEEYIQVFDVEDYLDQFIKFRKSNKKNLVGQSCPICSSTERDKFYVNKSGDGKNGLWNSYCCHDTGNLVKLISLIEGITEREAIHAIKFIVDGEEFNLKPLEPKESEKQVESVALVARDAEFPSELYNVTPDTPMVVDGQLKTLLDRGISQYIIDRHGLMMTGKLTFYAGKIRPELANRLVIPIADETGSSWLSWQARDMTGSGERKYLFPFEDKSSQVFYGWHQAKVHKVVLVVEGAPHKWAFDNLGREIGSDLVENMTIATFGKKMSAEQLEALIESDVEHVIFAWDLDAAEQIKRIASSLNGRKKVSIMLPPEDGRDWDQLSDDERKTYLANIEPFSLALMVKMVTRLAILKASKR